MAAPAPQAGDGLAAAAGLAAGPIVFQHGGMIAVAPHPAAPVARPGGVSA